MSHRHQNPLKKHFTHSTFYILQSTHAAFIPSSNLFKAVFLPRPFRFKIFKLFLHFHSSFLCVNPILRFQVTSRQNLKFNNDSRKSPHFPTHMGFLKCRKAERAKARLFFFLSLSISSVPKFHFTPLWSTATSFQGMRWRVGGVEN